MSHALAALSWPQTQRLADAGAVLAIPVGSTEQHGPHLPLSTDTDIAQALCDGLARSCPQVVVAPALTYGSSGEHAGFAGTMSIGREVLRELLVELVRSATDTFEHVLLVSAHGGNAVPVTQAVATLRAESRDVLVFWPRWDGDAHAGHVETSLMLSLHPDVVSMDAARVGNTAPIASLAGELRSAGVRAVSPNGVLGDPTRAAAADGARVLTHLLEQLAAQFRDWQATWTP